MTHLLEALAVVFLQHKEASKAYYQSLSVLSPHRLNLLSDRSLSTLSASKLQLFHLTFLGYFAVSLDSCHLLSFAPLLPKDTVLTSSWGKKQVLL